MLRVMTVLFALTAIIQIEVAAAKEKITDVFPESELVGIQYSQGGMTIPGFLATQSALEEIERRKLPLASYSAVTVQEAGSTFHVSFSQIPLNSGFTGYPPGYPPPLLVRVDKSSYKVLGSYLYPAY